jgi:hypothetical protein
VIFHEANGKHKIYLPDFVSTHFFNEEFIKILSNKISISGQDTISKTISRYYPSFEIGDKTLHHLFLFYRSDDINNKVLIFWYKPDRIDNANANEGENAIWELPYFEYKKHTQLPSFEFHTNNLGFRDKDIIIPKPSDVFRIVCIGSSTTEEGPTEQETYPNILERLLSEQMYSPYKIEVINAGIPGISAIKLWLRLPDFLLMQPDLIVYSEGANDITHTLIPYWLKDIHGYKKVLIQSKLFRNCFTLFFLPEPAKIRTDIEEVII